MSTCPECAQGKHQNCTKDVLDEHDNWIPCDCPVCAAKLGD